MSEFINQVLKTINLKSLYRPIIPILLSIVFLGCESSGLKEIENCNYVQVVFGPTTKIFNGKNQEIGVIELNRPENTPIESIDSTDFQFSPDGQQLIFVNSGHMTAKNYLDNPVVKPCVECDIATIQSMAPQAFFGYNEIVKYDLRTKQTTMLLKSFRQEFRSIRSPIWSSDLSKIYFFEGSNIYCYEFSSESVRLLYDIATLEHGNLEFDYGQFSQDGKTIWAVARFKGSPSELKGRDIYTAWRIRPDDPEIVQKAYGSKDSILRRYAFTEPYPLPLEAMEALFIDPKDPSTEMIQHYWDKGYSYSHKYGRSFIYMAHWIDVFEHRTDKHHRLRVFDKSSGIHF